jgi:hypothetical protein
MMITRPSLMIASLHVPQQPRTPDETPSRLNYFTDALAIDRPKLYWPPMKQNAGKASI